MTPPYLIKIMLPQPVFRAVWTALLKVEGGEQLSVEDADALCKLKTTLEEAGAP